LKDSRGSCRPGKLENDHARILVRWIVADIGKAKICGYNAETLAPGIGGDLGILGAAMADIAYVKCDMSIFSQERTRGSGQVFVDEKTHRSMPPA
jgi:hypothetical protein